MTGDNNLGNECEYGEDLPQGLGGRIVAGIVISVFLSSILGTGIADTFYPLEGIQLIGREAQEQARVKREANLWDGSLASYYEDRLREHSRVRRWLLPQYSYMKYVYLDEGPSEVTIGKQHWMFLTSRMTLAEQSDELLVSSAANSMVALDRRLRGNGIELTLIPVPRKSWVAHERLPRGADARHAIEHRLIEELKKRSVTTVDLCQPYDVENPEEIYFKLDDHWTPNGARIAAMETARSVGLLKPESERLGRLELLPLDRPFRMGFTTLRSIGVSPSKANLEVLNLREPQMTNLSFSPAIEQWFERATPSSPVALAGTSFSKQQQFAGLLSHYSGTAIFDGAKPALPFMAAVHKVLQTYARGETRLRQLFWEVPLASFYNGFLPQRSSFGKAYGRTFGATPPEHQVTLQRVPPEWIPLGKGQLTMLPRRRIVLLQVPPGTLAHSGDGVIALHISGEVMDGPLLLTLTNDELSLDLELRPGRFDAVLPITAQGPTAAALQLTAHPRRRVRLRIDDASIVHQPVGPALNELTRRAPPELTSFIPTSPLQLDRRTALGIQTDPTGNPQPEIVVELHTTGRASPHEVSFKRLLPGCWIVMDLGRYAGERLTGVSLHSATGELEVRAVTVTGAQ